MAEKMEGVLAELKTYNATGKEMQSQIVFKPYCDWYIEQLHDGYAETKYLDMGAVIDEFGLDVATKVIEGEIVKVEREVPEGFRQTSCRVSIDIIKNSSSIRWPFPGGRKEYLVRSEK